MCIVDISCLLLTYAQTHGRICFKEKGGWRFYIHHCARESLDGFEEEGYGWVEKEGWRLAFFSFCYLGGDACPDCLGRYGSRSTCFVLFKFAGLVETFAHG